MRIAAACHAARTGLHCILIDVLRSLSTAHISPAFLRMKIFIHYLVDGEYKYKYRILQDTLKVIKATYLFDRAVRT